MTIAAWVIAGGVGLYAVTLLIARFAGSNSAVRDDLTDEQLLTCWLRADRRGPDAQLLV